VNIPSAPPKPRLASVSLQEFPSWLPWAFMHAHAARLIVLEAAPSIAYLLGIFQGSWPLYFISSRLFCLDCEGPHPLAPSPTSCPHHSQVQSLLQWGRFPS
jgi:hypothetical protein